MPTLHPFTTKLRKAGLYRGLAESHVQILQIIEAEPLPMPKKGSKSDKNIPSPSPIQGSSLGPCVAQRCVAFDRESMTYKITDSGREYLRKLREANLIPQPQQVEANHETTRHRQPS